MGSEALLQRACELAFAVARDEAEGNPPIDPPGDMRSFLYLNRLPRRAISVAQQAIEDDHDFRSRVASRATEQQVGRAGLLWLQRPIGWVSEFDALSRASVGGAFDGHRYNGRGADASNTAAQAAGGFQPAGITSDIANSADDDDEIDLEHVNPVRGLADETTDGFMPNLLGTDDGLEVEPDLPEFPMPSTNLTTNTLNGDVGPEEVAVNSQTTESEADAIENELSSLRGLVDRLAGERENVHSVSTSSRPSDGSVAELEDELSALASQNESLKHELAMATEELQSGRGEHDDARRLHSEALQRQVELERELSELREQLAVTENRSSEFQASLLTIEDKYTRVKSEAEELEREHNVTRAQLDTMTEEHSQVREDRLSIKAERDDLANRLAEVNEKAGGVDIDELASSNKSLTSELDATSRELARMIAQVETLEQQLHETTTTADALKVEHSEASSRLADTELSLSTTQTRHEALKTESEKMAAELGTLRAERDGLQSQVGELQVSLSEVLDDQAEARHRNDADRKALNEIRVERDVLQARVNDIEQTHKSYENRINALSKERDDLLAARDDLVTERGQLRGEAAAAATAREQLVEKIDTLESNLGPLETELQAERRQREELANRLLQLDEIAATNNAATELLAKERDDLLSAVTELREERDNLREVKRERDQLKGQSERAEQRADRAERQMSLESEKQSAAASELNDKVSQLEATRQTMEGMLADNETELLKLRADVEELNSENTKLRFNLQVAESSVIEASDSAEKARQESVEARARIVELEASTEAVSRFADAGKAQQPAGDPDVAPQPSLTDFVTDKEEPEQSASLDGDIVDEVLDPDKPAATMDEQIATKEWSSDDVADVSDVSSDNGVDVGDEFASLTPLDEAEAANQERSVVNLDDRRDESFANEALVNESLGQPAWGEDSYAPADDQNRDELDEISELISQTAAGFDQDGSDPGFGEAAAVGGLAVAGAANPPSLLDGQDASLSDFELFDNSSSDSTSPNNTRTTIDVPPSIASDELAAARHIVSSPDMVLLVDGDSVASMGWPSLSVAEQRDALVTYLADLSSSSGAAPDVVFDGRVGEDDALPASQRAVRIRLSTPPVDPAAALEELLDAYPAQWPLALVTDDAALAALATERGASVLNNGQLLDLFLS